MPYEITNTLRSKSIVRVVGNTATTINLSSLSSNTSLEAVDSASIAEIISSSDGKWDIYRGDNTSGTLIFTCYGSAIYPLTQSDIVIANSSTSNIHVTNSGTGGTLILVVSKQTTYNPALI